MELADVEMMAQEFFLMALMLTTPVVVVSLVVGLVISIAQTVTSVQEQTLSFAPRIIAVVVLLIAMTNWYLVQLQNYTTHVIEQMVEFIR